MRKVIIQGLLLVFFSLCFAFQHVEDLATTQILTPSFRERKTAKIRLDNGLEAYLISDPRTTESAAALSISVGSWHDPKPYPGLAHFLEHMLFMGSGAYPKENEYSSFIRDHGGNENAYTYSDQTIYAFSIQNTAFKGALDRFSHFFIDPLFSPSAIDRELHAVDEEYSLHKEDSSYRKWMVIKETCNAEHPHSHFCIGNQETLKQVDQSVLQKWYHQHYSSNRMHLVLISPLSIEELIETTDQFFSSVPTRSLSIDTFPNAILSQKQKGQMIYVEIEGHDPLLELIWEFPSTATNEREVASMKLAAVILANPLKNGLKQLLKRKGLANRVDVSANTISQHHVLFNIQIALTEMGTDNMEEVILNCFQAIATQKQKEIPQYLFEELQKLSTLSYQYQSREDPFAVALFHADQLIKEPLETYPEKSIFLPFNPADLKTFLQKLTPLDCFFLVTADSDATGIKGHYEETWTQARYDFRTIHQDLLSEWQAANAHLEIDFPLANPFLPKPHLISPPEQSSIVTLDETQCKIYFKQDTTYLTPTLCTLFTVTSPLFDKTARSEILLSLFIKAWNKQLKTTAYFANQAGIDYQLSHELGKLHIEVEGYSDQVPTLVKKIVDRLHFLTLSEEQFEQIKVDLLNQLAVADDPLKQSEIAFYEKLFPYHPRFKERIDALLDLSLTDFIDFLDELSKQYYVEGFLYGNLDESTARALWNDLKESLPPSRLSYYQNTNDPPVKPIAGLTTIEIEAEENRNATLLGLYQGPFTFKSFSAQALLSLAMRETFFDSLRTKQQTGYHVNSWNENLEQELFQFFSVESAHYSPEDLLERFETFLEDYLDHLKTYINLDRFEVLKQTQIAHIKKPSENVFEEAQKLHHLAIEKKGNFSWYDDWALALLELTYDEFLNFAQQSLLSNRPRMAILVNAGNLIEKK